MINPLPNWCITNTHPSVNDIESKTVIEQAARLYGKMQELINDYNEFEQQLNTAFATDIKNTIEKTVGQLDLKELMSREALDELEAICDSLSSLVNSAVNGAPAGVYETYADLITNNPTKTDRIYLVVADGKWYYYDLSKLMWTPGGEYLQPITNPHSLTQDVIKFAEITLLGPITFNRDTKVLSIPYPTYYEAGTNAAKLQPLFFQGTEGEDKTINLTNYEDYLCFIGIDKLQNGVVYTNETVTIDEDFRLIAIYYKGVFYGKNAGVINIVGEENKSDLLSVQEHISGQCSKVVMLGDSITAGVGATGYQESEDGTPRQTTSCWANRFAKYIGAQKYGSERLFIPDASNISAVGLHDFGADKDSLGYVVLRSYVSFKFKLPRKATAATLQFKKYTDCGEASVYVDGALAGSFDTYAESEDYHEFQIDLSGSSVIEHEISVSVGYNTQSSVKNPVVRFCGARVTLETSNTWINQGRAGWSSFHLAYNLENKVFFPDDADLFIIQIGTNDRIDMPSYECTKTFMRQVCSSLLENGKKIVLCTPPPHITEADGSYKFSVREVAKAIKQVASEFNLALIDFYELLPAYAIEKGVSLESFFGDGLHPNTSGYGAMFDISKRVLQI